MILKDRSCRRSTSTTRTNALTQGKRRPRLARNKPEFTLLKQPAADDLAKLFKQLTGCDVSKEEKQEMEKALAKKKSG